MVLRTEQVASPAWARQNEADWYTNRIRHYPRILYELTTERSWRGLFRKRVVASDAVVELGALHPRGPIYHHRDDDRLVILRPVDGVSAAVVESSPVGRTYYGSRYLGIVLEEDPKKRHDSLDLAETDLTVREGLEQFRPIVRREKYEDGFGMKRKRRRTYGGS